MTVRGTYSTVGFRADADLMLWLHGDSPDVLQRAVVELRRTAFGRLVEPTWMFMGAVKPAEFTPDHAPAFVKGDGPEKFLCVYPFVRTPEWYLLPPEERGEMLREHGVAGREFPEVLANTTSAFGLGDWEWILAFEAARADSLVDCIRRLREAKARLFTKVGGPVRDRHPQAGRRRPGRSGLTPSASAEPSLRPSTPRRHGRGCACRAPAGAERTPRPAGERAARCRGSLPPGRGSSTAGGRCS